MGADDRGHRQPAAGRDGSQAQLRPGRRYLRRRRGGGADHGAVRPATVAVLRRPGTLAGALHRRRHLAALHRFARLRAQRLHRGDRRRAVDSRSGKHLHARRGAGHRDPAGRRLRGPGQPAQRASAGGGEGLLRPGRRPDPQYRAARRGGDPRRRGRRVVQPAADATGRQHHRAGRPAPAPLFRRAEPAPRRWPGAVAGQPAGADGLAAVAAAPASPAGAGALGRAVAGGYPGAAGSCAAGAGRAGRAGAGGTLRGAGGVPGGAPGLRCRGDARGVLRRGAEPGAAPAGGDPALGIRAAVPAPGRSARTQRCDPVRPPGQQFLPPWPGAGAAPGLGAGLDERRARFRRLVLRRLAVDHQGLERRPQQPAAGRRDVLADGDLPASAAGGAELPARGCCWRS